MNMPIKKATLIALCGNAAWLAVHLYWDIGQLMSYPSTRAYFYFVFDIVGPGTLLLFLITLWRKQP